MMASDDKVVWIGCVEGTPLGELWAAVSAQGLVAVDFPADQATITRTLRRMGIKQVVYDPAKVQPALAQIGEYLGGRRRSFDLPIDWSVMTPFQQQALRETCAVPYGQTATYGELASTDWQAARRACRGACPGDQPYAAGDPLPPGARFGRRPAWLRRR